MNAKSFSVFFTDIFWLYSNPTQSTKYFPILFFEISELNNSYFETQYNLQIEI
jgi:hypothetical protein